MSSEKRKEYTYVHVILRIDIIELRIRREITGENYNFKNNKRKVSDSKQCFEGSAIFITPPPYQLMHLSHDFFQVECYKMFKNTPDIVISI